MERVTKGFCNPRISIAKDPLRCNSRSEQAQKTTSLNVEPRTSYRASVGRMPRTTRWTHLLISESFQLCNQVLGIHGKHRAINSNLHPGVSILQHITSLSRKLFTSDLRNASAIQAMVILPNYLPSTGWCRGYLATNRIGEFSMSAVLSIPELMRYVCDDNTSELNSPGHCHNP